MAWLGFSYSLPSKAQSSPRVALWRRLRRLGAIAPTGGIYLLPDREECLEAFQWLTEEVKQAKGDALVMHVDQFEGLSDADLIERFRQARAGDYAALEVQAAELETHLRAELTREERSQGSGQARAKMSANSSMTRRKRHAQRVPSPRCSPLSH